MQREKKCIPSNRASSLYLGSIRHLFNEAKKKYNDYDRNILLISNSPFENFKVPKQEATRKRALSAELIKKIWELPYIYNVNGTQLQSFAVTTGNAVKSHLLASGVYVVNVQTKGRADYTTKVYVE